LVPYRSIEDPAKLRRLLESVLLLERAMELPDLLRHIIEESMSMTGARYGALGVLDEGGTALSQFVTVGLDPEEEARIGPRPTGKGVLGVLIRDPHPIRVADIGTHPDSYGFPPNHPPMTSFLGVPIKVRGEIFGNLYLTDKIGWSEFTGDDEVLAEALALTAGIAIENARLHARVAEIAVYGDRDRMARDLHDTVIQRLFAVGLSLQSIVGTIEMPGIADRIMAAIAELDETIREVRSTIYELGSSRVESGVRNSILKVARELTPVLGFAPRVTFAGPIDTAVSDVIAEHLLITAREGLSNVGRHARATETLMTVTVSDGWCRLELVDNGQGFHEGQTDTRGGGLGLLNLQRRAEKLHGTFDVGPGESGGTHLRWEVPI